MTRLVARAGTRALEAAGTIMLTVAFAVLCAAWCLTKPVLVAAIIADNISLGLRPLHGIRGRR